MKKRENYGGVTIPTEAGFLEQTLKIMEEWGADAVRNSDGTELPAEIAEFADKVYSTYFVTRGDNNWAMANLDELQHFYLMTERFLAKDERLTLTLLEGYLGEQVQPDFDADPHRYWEAIDRTEGKVMDVWTFDADAGTVTIENTVPMHEYTVSFLAKTIWDSTQMYNYITNNWTKEHELSYDPRYPKTREYILRHMREWLNAHPDVDVVRFTTFFYHFTLLFNADKKEKYVDWFGYSASVSPRALDAFEEEYGYRLRAEDIVDAGYYNNPFRVPSKAFLDYMDFTQRFVTQTAKRLVAAVHEAGKEAMMFLGDTWIGAEPYGRYFESIGLDAVVGSVGGGVTVRMLTDIPGVKYTEGRFLPYFFPDTFREGGKPTEELNRNWLTARRALMRKPLDRIGYGGYLSLAAKFPDFIRRVGEIAGEFRAIVRNIAGAKPYCGLKVGILNAWGKLRSWQCHMVAHELWYKQIYSYQGILEALSGMNVEVRFFSFEDVLKTGIPRDLDVVINAGMGGTAYSGGKNWLNPRITSALREWIYRGGGFIGVGEPTASLSQGRYFQLAAALGVERELGFTLSHDKYNWQENHGHFILADAEKAPETGEPVVDVYALPGAEVLRVEKGNVTIAVNVFGHGKCCYFAGLPYSAQNCRMLLRALYYVSDPDKLFRWFSSNPETECHTYPERGMFAVVNNSGSPQPTTLYDGEGKAFELLLTPMEIKWLKA